MILFGVNDQEIDFTIHRVSNGTYVHSILFNESTISLSFVSTNHNCSLKTQAHKSLFGSYIKDKKVIIVIFVSKEKKKKIKGRHGNRSVGVEIS